MFRLVFLIFFFSLISASAQELPPTINYLPNEYNAGNQNWMVSQGEDGSVYAANSSGLLEFTGEAWNLYPMPNQSIVRSVKVLENRIYTGAYMEAGYWVKNEFGELTYTSLVSKFSKEIKDGEQFWHIESLGSWIIFQSFEGVYFYDTSKNEIIKINAPNKEPISNLFKADEKIFFLTSSHLYAIRNGNPEPIIELSLFKNNPIVSISKKTNDLLLISQKGKFYNWNGNSLAPNHLNISESLGEISIFSAIKLNDNSLILGTIADGIYHIDLSGIILSHFTQKNGLINNTALSVYEDRDQNVWAGLDNGLSVLNLDSPFSLFEDRDGKIGAVYTSYQDSNYLYLGTNQGLYYAEIGNTNFRLIEGTNGQVWSLKKIGNILFCGHNNGTFIVEGISATKIDNKLGTWDVVRLPSNTENYIQGHYDGLSILRKDNNGLTGSVLLANFPHSSKSIVVEKSGLIWVSNEHKGVFRIKLNDSLTSISEIKNYPMDSLAGITSNIFKFNNDLYYSTKETILKYDSELDRFSPNNDLSTTLDGLSRITGKLIPEADEKLWGFAKNSIFNISLAQLSEGFTLNKIAIPTGLRNSTLGYENIAFLNSGKYLIGVSNGYLEFSNSQKQKGHNYKTRIDKITNYRLDQESQILSLKENDPFHYRSNNFVFHFSVPVYNKFLKPLYSYRLKGSSDNWSEFSTSATATFKNLSYGEYNFEVKASIGEEITNIESFRFIISKPWFLSIYALLNYLSIFVILLYFLYKTNVKHRNKLVKEAEQLLLVKNMEAEQEIIKLKNEQLEKDMVNKNRELAVSTMSLIKKNEFLTNIKNKLKETPELNPKIKSVIKTIDQDINEEDNWNFFKKAFSNADKDFFKKIKAIHPELTSNDLKLCAYLRLNLSSKEIAPLLNISVKSVEIKRYRLRKKMVLPHNSNLTDYILEV